MRRKAPQSGPRMRREMYREQFAAPLRCGWEAVQILHGGDPEGKNPPCAPKSGLLGRGEAHRGDLAMKSDEIERIHANGAEKGKWDILPRIGTILGKSEFECPQISVAKKRMISPFTGRCGKASSRRIGWESTHLSKMGAI